MMKRKDFDKMSPSEQKLFLELVGNYQVKVTKRKTEQQRNSDLPLFKKDEQTKLF